MPTRIIRDGILTSERIALLNWAEEVFYRRVMSVADDYGRYYAHPSLLRAACYPLLLNKVSDSDIEKWLTACVNAALVRVYPAPDGKRYLEMQDFGQRIQGNSKFPAPEALSQKPTGMSGESPEHPAVVEVVVVVEETLDRQADPFGAFWDMYPKKVGKKPARDKWKAKKLDAKADAILTDIGDRLKLDQRWKGGFIPNPATYLTQERWMDDWKAEVAPAAPSGVPRGKPAGPSETPLERAVQHIRYLHSMNQIDATERDKRITEATDKHRSLQ